MQDSAPRWQIVVPTGGDALRQERLTRDLYDTLQATDGLTVGFNDDDKPAEPGHKGAAVGEIALWAATATAVARPASQVLIALIKEWCAKQRHRKVELTYGVHSVRITGRPDAAQERMVRDFLDRAAGGEDAGPEDGAA
ncbi:hypothetical protein [Streptomyces sp. MK7]|uniref:hypothetical protein n=1 Tax=Streptomyces sp. MK7 TaxID=3067635 RepID=UPI002931213B|nr:hypothetical protein [Streptomyces sp. MK7]